MSEVKALFPIGKTQWRKWNDMQRKAFNSLMSQGKSFHDAVALASAMTDVFEDLAETMSDVAEVIKTVKRTRTRKAK